MSVCANVFALFRNAPSAARLAEIAEIISNRTGYPVNSGPEAHGQLVVVDDADLLVDVNIDGSLNYLSRPRFTKLIGVPSIQGRLFQIGYLSRFWSPDDPQGPAIRYALTMLILLTLPDVEGVWYTWDGYSDGATLPLMTHTAVHRMIDDFVAVGEASHGHPTRYIRTEDSSVINV